MSGFLLRASVGSLLIAVCSAVWIHAAVLANVPGTVATLAGNGQMGLGGDKVSALKSPLSFPRGLAFDHKDRLTVVEVLNHRVRRVGPKDKIVTAAGSGPTGPTGGGFSGDGQAGN